MLDPHKTQQVFEVCTRCCSSSSASSEHMESNYNASDSSTTRTKLSVLPMFLLTSVAFVCLVLITFSLPLVHSMYFLWSSQAGGVRFGIWGWCFDEGPICAETLHMGYHWDPEISIPITKALVLYPTSAIAVLLTLIAFIPILRNRNPWTLRMFAVFAWVSLVSAFVAFGFMIAMWSVAEERFKAAGWKVRWGPLPWISFVSVISLIIVVVNTWKGALSPSYQAAQDLPSRVEPRLQEDPEKVIVSSSPPTSTSIPASPTSIAAPPPCYSLMAVKEDYDSTPVGRDDRCHCPKGSQISKDGLSSFQSQLSLGTEGNSPVLGYPRLPPEAIAKNTQKQCRMQSVSPGSS